MIEIAPELSPQGHCSSFNFRILDKNLDYKPQSSDSPGGDSPDGSLCESLSDILSSLSSDL